MTAETILIEAFQIVCFILGYLTARDIYRKGKRGES